MPTNNTEIRDAFRHAYEQMVDDSSLAPEWAELASPTLRATPSRRSPSGLLVAAVAALGALVVIGGAAWLVRIGSTTTDPGVFAASPSTAVARITVVFTPGALTDAELDEFNGVVDDYSAAMDFDLVDEVMAQEQAREHFQGDADALAVLQQRPDFAAGYAQIEFTNHGQAMAFQEQVGGLESVVVAVGSNGPRLGRGYGDLPLSVGEQDRVRGALWQYLYNLDLPEAIRSAEPRVTTTMSLVSEHPLVTSVSEVMTEDVPYLAENAPYPAGAISREEHVAQVIAVTGLDYDPRPGFAHDAVVIDGRAVFVGADAGIWYSDDGAWKPAVLNLPTGMTIGADDGDYRLGDGIQNIATDGTRLVAWEYIQIVQGTEPAGAGTLILTSGDGITWTAALTAEALSAVIPWGDGYIGGLHEPLPDLSGGSQSSLGWSTDLIDWTHFHDLGAGWAMAIEPDPEGLLVWFEDGSLPEPPEEDRNPDHPEDDPLNPFLRAYQFGLTQP